MLLNNFFYIDQMQTEDNQIVSDIRINTDHEILKGHFPGQPVVPGVCMIEMLKEVLGQAFGQRFQMKSASMIKFLTMFAPPAFDRARFFIQTNGNEQSVWQVNATLQFEEHIFLKFKGVFIEK